LEAPQHQLISTLDQQADSLRDAGTTATWTTVHGTTPDAAADHSRQLADALGTCQLPEPHPGQQYGVHGDLAWLITPNGDAPHPDAIWHLSDHHQVRDRLELLLGTPADARDEVGTDLAAAPSALRDAIAEALPAAAADPDATADPARWRIGAAAAAIARLTDPQPWSGPEAATTLLALSDHRIRTALLALTHRAPTGTVLVPDPHQLAQLVRAAPPGLVSGPATLLAAVLAQRGTSLRAQAAASLALADRPDNTAALGLLTALTRGDSPQPVLATITDQAPELASASGLLFTSADGLWPDPLAATTPGSPPTAAADGPRR
jgi:hypothetical protein